MQVECPQCLSKYRIADEKVKDGGVKLRCPKCQNVFQVTKSEPEPERPVSPSGRRIKVVVANESAAFCEAVKGVLASEPFDVFTFNDGNHTMAAVEQMKPDVVLLDVALPGMYGFEVCETIKNRSDLATVKVILIASIYDKTRYKREPKSLYHADDYIEKHHIPDELIPKIYELVEGGSGVVQGISGDVAEQDSMRETLRKAEEQAQPSSSPDISEAHTKARRIARTIASDIALYNQEKVEEGIRKGNFFQILSSDIEEGRLLYESRVGKEIVSTTSYLKEAFDDLITRKKKEMRL